MLYREFGIRREQVVCNDPKNLPWIIFYDNKFQLNTLIYSFSRATRASPTYKPAQAINKRRDPLQAFEEKTK